MANIGRKGWLRDRIAQVVRYANGGGEVWFDGKCFKWSDKHGDYVLRGFKNGAVFETTLTEAKLAKVKNVKAALAEQKKQDAADKALKEKQLAEILANNPMKDDYHTGIRTVDDIRTAKEAFIFTDDDDSFPYPDFTAEDAVAALKTGYITVFSSHELKSGTFVTPSLCNARDYAGGRNAKVFSKRVPLNAVAWLGPDEGQYCPKALEKQNESASNDSSEADENPDFAKFEAVYGTSKVWSSDGGLVVTMDVGDDDFVTFVPSEFFPKGKEVDCNPLLEAGFELDDKQGLFFRPGKLDQETFNALCKAGVIDPQIHTLEDGRNLAHIDKERHKYLREIEAFSEDLPKFETKKEEAPKDDVAPKKDSSEKKASEPQEQPNPEPADKPKPTEESTTSKKSASDIFMSITDDMNVEEKNRLVGEWAKKFFADDDPEWGKKETAFFTSNDVPFYQKQFALNFLNSENNNWKEKGLLTKFDHIDDLERFAGDSREFYNVDFLNDIIDACDSSNGKSWRELISGDQPGVKYCFGAQIVANNFTAANRYFDGAFVEDFATREKGIEKFRSRTYLPKSQTTEADRAAIDAIFQKYLDAAALPTTTDAEAAGILNTLSVAHFIAKKRTQGLGTSHYKPDFFEQEIAFRLPNSTLDEIIGRAGTPTSKPEAKTPEPQKNASDEATPEEPPKPQPEPEPEAKPAPKPEPEPEPESEPKPEPEPEPTAEPETGDAQEEKPAFVTFYDIDDIFKKMDETGDMSELSKVQSLFEKWSNEYFADEDEDEGRLHRFFASKDVPVYAKRSIINIANQKRGTTPLQQCASYQNFQKYIDVPEDPSILHSVKQSINFAVNEYERRSASPYKDDQYQNLYILGGAQFDGTVPDNSAYAFRKAVNEANRAEMVRLSKTFRLARGATKSANESAKKILNRCLSVVASPTTTDYEAKGIVMAFKRATMKYSSKLKRDLVKPSDDYIAKEMERLVPESALREIEARTGENESSSSDATQPPPAPTPDVPAPTEEKPQAPMTESGKGTKNVSYAKTADDFLKICDEVRNEIMTPEEAERDRQETTLFASEFHKLIPQAYLLLDAINRGETFTKDQEETRRLFLDFNGKAKNNLCQPLNSREMERNLSILRAAFPDNGGKSFFSDEFKRETIDFLKKHGLKEENASYIFKIYDILGTSFNLSDKKYKMPIIKGAVGKVDEGGSYDLHSNTIILNVRKRPAPTMSLQISLIHELAHWLEARVFGDKIKGESLDWLANETGRTSELQNLRRVRSDIRPQKQIRFSHAENPHLCFRYEGYSLTLYSRVLYWNDDGTRLVEDSGTSEVFSTGMEGLGACPSKFATTTPKHFNHIIDCFRKFFEQNS